MWRWPTVAAQKEASAKEKSKTYAIHSKIIALAAERGADPWQNNALADAITTAKKAWVNIDVIDRAIKRWAGLDTNTKKVEEILYEGYLPWGIAVIVKTLTDNRNRTAPSIRHIFSDAWGNLGETGSVSNYIFDHIGEIRLTLPKDMEAFENSILETDALDYSIEWEFVSVITSREKLMSVKSSLRNGWYTIDTASLIYRPKTYIETTDSDHILQLYSFLEACEEDEDIEVVYNNADISDSLWQETQKKVEMSRFRT